MRDDGREVGSQDEAVPVINLAEAPGEREAWGRPAWVVFLWGMTELLFVTNPLQVSSALRVTALRLFGAHIGDDVVFRPRTRVKFPWNLTVGDRSWIGEGVWIHNQAEVKIGHDVVISQETFITTGSHAHRTNMGLVMMPVEIDDGCWITSRCIVVGGVHLSRSTLVTPGSVISKSTTPGTVWGAPPSVEKGRRFRPSGE